MLVIPRMRGSIVLILRSARAQSFRKVERACARLEGRGRPWHGPHASRRITALRGGGRVCAPICAAMLLSMRASATVILGRGKNQPVAVGNDRWFTLPVSGLLFTGNAATSTCRATSAWSADLTPPGASPPYFSLLFTGPAERRSAAAVAGRAFRARGAVTACRRNQSQGPP